MEDPLGKGQLGIGEKTPLKKLFSLGGTKGKLGVKNPKAQIFWERPFSRLKDVSQKGGVFWGGLSP